MGTNSNEKKRMSTQKAKIQLSTTQIKSTGKKSEKDSSASDKQKKLCSFDTLVASMKPSTEELKYRKDKLRESGFVKKYSKFFKCTKCQINIKPHVVKHEKVPVHPCLGVLMCENCCNYYQDGEFSLDSDGEDKYCRWCGEGGTIFSCSNCICGFCLACIKRHFKSDYLKQVQEDENWLCFFCNPEPLWDQRFICSLALKLSENEDLEVSSSSVTSDKEDSITGLENLNSEQNATDNQEDTITKRTFKRKKIYKKKKKITGENSTELKNSDSKLPSGKWEESKSFSFLTSSSDESDLENPKKRVRHTSTPLKKSQENNENDSFENLKDNVLSKLKKVLSLSEKKMNFGVTWSNEMLEKLSGPGYITTHEGLVVECQKIKRVLSTMSAYLFQFGKSVDLVEKTLHSKNDGAKVQNDFPSNDQPTYINILQFLGFIRGQVKTFMEKGVSLSDIFEAEVYDDDKVIGLKKKSNFLMMTSSQNKCERSTSGGSKDNGSESKEDTLQKKDVESGGRDDNVCDVVVNHTNEKDNLQVEDQDEYKDQEAVEKTSTKDNLQVEDQDEFKDQEVVEKTSTKDCLLIEEEDGCKDNDSSSTTFVELNDLKNADPKDDIREILAILENA